MVSMKDLLVVVCLLLIQSVSWGEFIYDVTSNTPLAINSDGSINTRTVGPLGNDITSANPLYVSLDGGVDELNSTGVTLAAGETWTGSAVNIEDVAVIMVAIYSDVTSTLNGFKVKYSTDGVDFDIDDQYTVPTESGKTYSFQPAAKYYRLQYTNGATDQTTFHLHSLLKHTYVKPSSHRIQDLIIDDDDAELVKSVLTGKSSLTGYFENVKTYREALQVDSAFVHEIGISEHLKRDSGAASTFTSAVESGDITVNVASSTGFTVGDLVRISNGTVKERSHFHIVAVAGNAIGLDRPVDNDFSIGDDLTEIQINMNRSGTRTSPLSFKLIPSSDERFQITRIMITMTDKTAPDDSKFGGMAALTNGVVLRVISDGEVRTLTHWKSNGDLKDDMYDVTYADPSPAGDYGIAGRWTFTRAEFVVDIDGANGDYLELLVQDNLTLLNDFEIKCQGRLFGG